MITITITIDDHEHANELADYIRGEIDHAIDTFEHDDMTLSVTATGYAS